MMSQKHGGWSEKEALEGAEHAERGGGGERMGWPQAPLKMDSAHPLVCGDRQGRTQETSAGLHLGSLPTLLGPLK